MSTPDTIPGLLDNNGFMTILSIMTAIYALMPPAQKKHFNYNFNRQKRWAIATSVIFAISFAYLLFYDVFSRSDLLIPIDWMFNLDRQSSLLALSILLTVAFMIVASTPINDTKHILEVAVLLLLQNDITTAREKLIKVVKNSSIKEIIESEYSRLLFTLTSSYDLTKELIIIDPETAILLFNHDDLERYQSNFLKISLTSKNSFIDREIFNEAPLSRTTQQLMSSNYFSENNNDLTKLFIILEDFINSTSNDLNRPHKTSQYMEEHWKTPILRIIQFTFRRIEYDINQDKATPSFNSFHLQRINKILLDSLNRDVSCKECREFPSKIEYLIYQVVASYEKLIMKISTNNDIASNITEGYIIATIDIITHKSTTERSKAMYLSSLSETCLRFDRKLKISQKTLEIVSRDRQEALKNQLLEIWKTIPKQLPESKDSFHLIGNYEWNKKLKLPPLNFNIREERPTLKESSAIEKPFQKPRILVLLQKLIRE